MPRVMQRERIGPYTVKMLRRAPGESYYTRYAIITYKNGFRSYDVFDSYAYGEYDYMKRKWPTIIENVRNHCEEPVS